MSNLNNLRNEISETEFGQFYYQAKSHYIEKESPKWLVKDEFWDLGTLSHFIEWFGEQHKDKRVPPFDVLIRRIKELCTKDNETDYSACFKIIEPMLSFPDLLRSESDRKTLYQTLNVKEYHKRRREIDRERAKYKEAIKTIQKYNPNFDTRHLISSKEIGQKLPLSRTYATVKMMLKRGIIFAEPRGRRKSSKGYQMLRNFIRVTFTVAREHGVKEHAISVRVASILNLLKIHTSKGTEFKREHIEHYKKEFTGS